MTTAAEILEPHRASLDRHGVSRVTVSGIFTHYENGRPADSPAVHVTLADLSQGETIYAGEHADEVAELIRREYT